MKEALSKLLATLAVCAIPIGLIWSFMVNHGLAPNGDDKPKKDSKTDDQKSDTASTGSEG